MKAILKQANLICLDYALGQMVNTMMESTTWVLSKVTESIDSVMADFMKASGIKENSMDEAK